MPSPRAAVCWECHFLASLEPALKGECLCRAGPDALVGVIPGESPHSTRCGRAGGWKTGTRRGGNLLACDRGSCLCAAPVPPSCRMRELAVSCYEAKECLVSSSGAGDVVLVPRSPACAEEGERDRCRRQQLQRRAACATAATPACWAVEGRWQQSGAALVSIRPCLSTPSSRAGVAQPRALRVCHHPPGARPCPSLPGPADGFSFLVFVTSLRCADVCDIVRHQRKVVVVLDLDNTLVDAAAVAVTQKDW